ncbi:MAG: ArsR/SmtB family transcription factor [Thermoplasmata archaeon]
MFPEGKNVLAGDFNKARVTLIKALGDETRLDILRWLQREKELNVTEVCERTGKEQSNVSHHLTCLRNCGLVSTKREGKKVYYRLNGQERVRQILELIDEHVAKVMADILACREVET